MHRLSYYYTKSLQQELTEIEEPEENFYHIEFDDETKMEVKPFELQNFLSDECNRKVKELTTDSKNGLSFKIKKNVELNLLYELKKFKHFCGITFHKFLNQTKGIIYIQNRKFSKKLEKKKPERRVPIHRKRN